MDDVHGNISHAMRDNYNEYGVEEYYRKVAATYRNPFYPSVKQVVWSIMSKWMQAESSPSSVRVLDMAAGSGEVTEALLEWEKAHRQSPPANITTPFNSRAFIPPNARRLAAPTLRLPDAFNLDIVATDPYTSSAYSSRTHRQCPALSFADLANGDLPTGATQQHPTWDIVICSFALHLVPSASELFALLYELSSKATWLIVIAPHKKPEIKDGWGWTRWDISRWAEAGKHEEDLAGDRASGAELVQDKTRLRLYRTVLH